MLAAATQTVESVLFAVSAGITILALVATKLRRLMQRLRAGDDVLSIETANASLRQENADLRARITTLTEEVMTLRADVIALRNSNTGFVESLTQAADVAGLKALILNQHAEVLGLLGGRAAK